MTAHSFAHDASPAGPAGALGLGAFGPIGVWMHFAAGEEIYVQGDAADLIYQVIDGAVRSSCLLSDGRRQIGDFYYPGDLLGLGVEAEHRFSAEALCDCDILVVKRATLRRIGEKAVELERLIWAATARELDRTQEHLMLLGRKTAIEKVASFLLGLAARFGGETIALPMGRQDMADYLGLTIETVSRMLGQLQAEGLVAFTGCRQFRVARRSGLAQLVAG